MNKKANTLLFTLISTVANIIMTLAIILILCLISFLIMNNMLHIKNAQLYTVVWMFCFLGGMVLGMFLFTKLCGIVINKFDLESKLDSRLLGKYIPGGKKGAVQEKEEPKQKTVMPSSVLGKKDTWGEEETAPLPQPPAEDAPEVYPPLEQFPPTLDKKD